MDPSIYNAAISGDVRILPTITYGEVFTNFHNQKTCGGNNIFHLAAQFKQYRFFTTAVPSREDFPYLWAANEMGDTPLHIASRVAFYDLVDFIVRRAQPLHTATPERELNVESYNEVLRKTNKKGHTPLQVAAQYGHTNVVKRLILADPQLCGGKESPLFLATCAGFHHTATTMIWDNPSQLSFEGVNGVTALHAAVCSQSQQSKGLVELMVSKFPHMSKEVDVLGWTSLHYAAFKGNSGVVELLMGQDQNNSYMLDKHGMTALHIAAYKGHIETMKELIKCRPDTCESLNAKYQTILHVAVIGAQTEVVTYILETPSLRQLMNQADGEGHTPYQLAVNVIGQNHTITTMLMQQEPGFTLSDENILGEGPNNMQVPVDNQLTEQMRTNSSHKLCSFGVTTVASFQEHIISDFKKFTKTAVTAPNDDDIGKSAILNDPAVRVKSEINLLIAALIATVTFSAALSKPGGYGPDGKAVLQYNTYFKWFQQINTTAFLLAFTVLLCEYFLVFLGPKIFNRLFRSYSGGSSLVIFSLGGMYLAILFGTNASLSHAVKPDGKLTAFSMVYGSLPIAVSVIRAWFLRKK